MLIRLMYVTIGSMVYYQDWDGTWYFVTMFVGPIHVGPVLSEWVNYVRR